MNCVHEAHDMLMSTHALTIVCCTWLHNT